VGGRFDDEVNEERSAYEERCNAYTTEHYLLPTFNRLFGHRNEPVRLLSLGCGTGVDVDMLSAAGYEIAGIDCGKRSDVWPRRRFASRLHLANGKHLPFEDGTFDLAYCGCVFPHVGTIGESHKLAPNFREERSAMACEMCRVLKRGGRVLVSSPNRLCPVDIFHGRSKENPFPRLNLPNDPFLLSPGDYRSMFGAAGCTSFRLLPVDGYWGFINLKTHWKGRILAAPVETIFRVVSNEALRFLRPLPVSPWLVMLIQKGSA
jgi:SAM-dependent methyltransferase